MLDLAIMKLLPLKCAVIICILIASLLVSAIGYSKEGGSTRLNIGNFSLGLLNGWQSKSLVGETDYQIIRLDGNKVLKAVSNQTASGIYYEKNIDLKKTPVLNWRWRIEDRLANSKEQEKSGDDFAARIYVVVGGGLAFWNIRAVNYVWSNQAPKFKSWPNPFAGFHAMTFVLHTGNDKTGTWFTEKRNIREDFKLLIGEDITTIDAVAIMTDTDNTGGHATAYYGDIYFSAE